MSNYQTAILAAVTIGLSSGLIAQGGWIAVFGAVAAFLGGRAFGDMAVRLDELEKKQ